MLRTHAPSGKIPPPVALIEGDEGSGKSWLTAELSASARVSRTLWLELGKETTAEQYGAIPNARYEIVDPDTDDPNAEWDYRLIYRAVKDASAAARAARDAGEPPVVLVVDTVGAIWDMLSEWADNRARSSKTISESLAKDPNAEYVIGHAYWNDATARWQKLMTLWLKFPGIVILLSRGQEVTLFENGQPTRRKTWKVEGQKGMTADIPIWIRMTRDGNPQLIKFRSVVNGIRPGVDRARALPNLALDDLFFNRLGWDPATGGERTVRGMAAGSDAPPSELANVLELAIESAADVDQLDAVYPRITAAVEAKQLPEVEGRRLWGLANAAGRRLAPPPPPAPAAVQQPGSDQDAATQTGADASAALALALAEASA